MGRSAIYLGCGLQRAGCGAPGATAGGRSEVDPVSVAVLDLQAYLNRLASAQPVPGGGSAATIVGALGAALVAMVARLTLGSPKYAAVHADAVLLVADADALRARFMAARPVDETAYLAVTQAQALPGATPAEQIERRKHVQLALAAAAQAPLEAAGLAGELVALCARAAELHNANLMSDVECALSFGQAALAASAANVRINHRFLKDAELVSEQSLILGAIIRAAGGHERTAQAFIAGE